MQVYIILLYVRVCVSLAAVLVHPDNSVCLPPYISVIDRPVPTKTLSQNSKITNDKTKDF